MDFFIKGELLEFKEYAGKRYDKNEYSSQMARDRVVKPTWDKTEFWLNSVSDIIPSISIDYEQRWIIPSKNSKFKNYTWGRIFTENNEKKDIYFTLGVHADGSLLMKIDFHFVSDILTHEQKKKAETLIYDTNGWKYCKIIDVEDIQSYDWDKLVYETVSFIEGRIEVYEKIVEEIYEVEDLVSKKNTSVFKSNVLYVEAGNHDKGNGDSLAYTIGKKEIFAKRKHNEISLRIYDFLKNKYKNADVSREQRIANGNQIDLMTINGDEKSIYEIKAYYNSKRSIREGIGQLLEYAHYSFEEKKINLIIVALVPMEELDRKYLKRIQTIYQLPVFYNWFDEKQNILIEN